MATGSSSCTYGLNVSVVNFLTGFSEVRHHCPVHQCSALKPQDKLLSNSKYMSTRHWLTLHRQNEHISLFYCKDFSNTCSKNVLSAFKCFSLYLFAIHIDTQMSYFTVDTNFSCNVATYSSIVSQ